MFAWSKDFNSSLQQSNSAQVWVKIYGLSQEYWRPKILFAIASIVGTSICTNSPSTKTHADRTFGQFIRVLVDMDVTQTLRYKVMVERKIYAFFMELDYENFPDFCTYSKKIGHYVEICKSKNKEDAIKDVGGNKKLNKEARKKFIIERHGRKELGKNTKNLLTKQHTKQVILLRKTKLVLVVPKKWKQYIRLICLMF